MLHARRVLRPGNAMLRSGNRVLRPAEQQCSNWLWLRTSLLRSVGVNESVPRELSMTTRLSTDAIWSHLNSDLRRFIRRRVSDEHAADDLLQETFLRVHRNVGALRDEDRLVAWVYQIARNAINDRHRRSNDSIGELADAEQVEDTAARPSEGSCRAGQWLEEMVHLLPDGYREAVRMSELDELSQQEVADRLGLSLSGAKSRIQRGRSMLKDELEKCCHYEFDRRGNLLDCDPKRGQRSCGSCDR